MMSVAGDPLKPRRGVAAAFASEAGLRQAADHLREANHRGVEYFSPYPLEGLDRGPDRSAWLGGLVFLAGLLGLAFAAVGQYLANAELYPVLVGGRVNGWAAWPSFLPISFEMTILFGAIAAVGGFLLMSRLPRWHQPMLAWDEFTTASDNRLFLFLPTPESGEDYREMAELLTRLGAEHVAILHDD